MVVGYRYWFSGNTWSNLASSKLKRSGRKAHHLLVARSPCFHSSLALGMFAVKRVVENPLQ
jgi:hypothetical protein